MARIVVYGSSGVGKSTLASELARRYGVDHVEIDLLAYDSNGVQVPQDLLGGRFEAAIRTRAWVVEGMHRDQLYRALESADSFIWLDYSRYVVGRRLAARLLSQLVFRTKRHGRRTTARSSLRRELPFVLKTLSGYPRRRAHGEALASHASSLHLRVERMSSPRHLRRLLQGGAAGGSVA